MTEPATSDESPAKAITYTDEQACAIGAGEVSIALAAGAGCGKTFVLTERFLKELQPGQGASPEQRLAELLAITFTDAAARELRTRIRSVVADRIRSAEPDERDYWQQLQRALDACRVSTFHSLCGNLLRTHAFDLGLDPLFTTLDAASAKVLQSEAIEDTLRQELTERDPDAFELASTWGIEGLKQRIAGLVDHHRSQEFIDWAGRTPSDLLAAWETFYREKVWPLLCRNLSPLGEELTGVLHEFSPANETAAEKKRALLDLLALLKPDSTSKINAEQLQSIQDLAKANRLPFTKKNWGDDSLYERFRDLAKKLREQIAGMPDADFTADSVVRSAELGLQLARLTQKGAAAYSRSKESRNAIDFDDLLALAHRLLTDPAFIDIQQKLHHQIRLLMVDEFQDTDRLQVAIVKALAGEVSESGKLFFVGDDKQSIYRFRGAEPQVFMDLRGEVAEEWRLPLSMNFRSQPAILQFVNQLFDNVFEGAYQRLAPSRPQVSPEPAIEFRWVPLGGNPKEAGWTARSRQAEARSIAARLREMFDSETALVADKQAPGGCRPAQPGDVAILFRVLSDVQHYEEALRQENIDYYLVGGHAFYTQQEVYDVLHLLRSIASCCDELSLAGVLRSPFFSLADESLFWIASHGRSLEAGLFAQELPRELTKEERSKVAAAADTLLYLRSMKEQVSVPQLLAEAFERTGYDATLLADFMGERKLANVQKLVEQARTAAAGGVGTLDDFVTQLTEFATSAPKEALAATTPETANVVRLMTIHQSKGLEFPIVVVPDLDRKATNRSSSVAFHPQLGPLVTDQEAPKKSASGLKLFQLLEKSEEAAEMNRLFYVACTRAADYLLLSAGVNEIDDPKGPWLKTLAQAMDLSTGHMQPAAHLPQDTTKQAEVQVCIDVPSARENRSSSDSRRTDLLQLIEQAKRLPTDRTTATLAAPLAAPLAIDPRWRRRFSVTRLSGQIVPAGGDWWQGESNTAVSPSAHQVPPLQLGTLVHAVLERVDFSAPEQIAPWCQTLAPLHAPLHADRAASDSQTLVEAFFDSDRFVAMREASQLHREVEFLLAWPLAESANPSLAGHEPNCRYLQGYLDGLYLGEKGRWKIVDYKTNHLAASEVSSVAAKYELQMLVYALAVEQTWGTGPDELVLHFLRPNVEYVIEWNDTTRERALQLVEAALAAANA